MFQLELFQILLKLIFDILVVHQHLLGFLKHLSEHRLFSGEFHLLVRESDQIETNSPEKETIVIEWPQVVISKFFCNTQFKQFICALFLHQDRLTVL